MSEASDDMDISPSAGSKPTIQDLDLIYTLPSITETDTGENCTAGTEADPLIVENGQDDIIKLKEQLTAKTDEANLLQEEVKWLYQVIETCERCFTFVSQYKNVGSLSGTSQGQSTVKTAAKSEPEVKKVDVEWVKEAEKNQTSIADIVREAAEESVRQIGFVYDEKNGCYYDHNTGYYYNADTGLYYHAKTGTYFYFDSRTNRYVFHSKVTPTTTDEPDEWELMEKKDKKKMKKKKKEKKAKKKSKSSKHKKSGRKRSRSSSENSSDYGDSYEEGELSGSETSGPALSNDELTEREKAIIMLPLKKKARQWPPCIRAMILQTDYPDKLPIGSLQMVTYPGAIIGRETPSDLLLPDANISKMHAEIRFQKDDKRYEVQDLGSRNGSVLNERTLGKKDGYVAVHHGDKLQLGSTLLLLHIHDGHDTCDECEPGLVKANASSTDADAPGAAKVTKLSREEERRRLNKELRRKFGLQSDPFEAPTPGTEDKKYKDRARERRHKKGVDYQGAKTEMASVDTAISSSNKGFKMMEKMGWKTGDTLGKSQEGIAEPILVEQRAERAGLGSDMPVPLPQTKDAASKAAQWKRTEQRYKELQEKEIAESTEKKYDY